MFLPWRSAMLAWKSMIPGSATVRRGSRDPQRSPAAPPVDVNALDHPFPTIVRVVTVPSRMFTESTCQSPSGRFKSGVIGPSPGSQRA